MLLTVARPCRNWTIKAQNKEDGSHSIVLSGKTSRRQQTAGSNRHVARDVNYRYKSSDNSANYNFILQQCFSRLTSMINYLFSTVSQTTFLLTFSSYQWTRRSLICVRFPTKLSFPRVFLVFILNRCQNDVGCSSTLAAVTHETSRKKHAHPVKRQVVWSAFCQQY